MAHSARRRERTNFIFTLKIHKVPEETLEYARKLCLEVGRLQKIVDAQTKMINKKNAG